MFRGAGKPLLGLVLLVGLLAATSELVLRALGRRPWAPAQVPIRVEPGGRLFQSDRALGYTLQPGSFTITLGSGLAFRATHGDDTLRVTHRPRPAPQGRARDEVWIFGCSYTYGWASNDDETYPWILQQKLPQHEVVNFGVAGYGTVQSLIQFEQALASRPRPHVAVLAYAAFHDERNTFLRVRRKQVAPWNRLGPLAQPFARADRSGRLSFQMAPVEFNELPLMRRSALAHAVEEAYNRLEARLYDSHRVSQQLISRFAEVAAAHAVPLVVAGISATQRTRAMVEFARTRGIPALDISVDLRGANSNLPYDPHPGVRAHRQYAQKLERFLEERELAARIGPSGRRRPISIAYVPF